MSQYKLRLDYKKWNKVRHRAEDFSTIFHRIMKLAKETNLMMTRYEEDDKFAYIKLDSI